MEDDIAKQAKEVVDYLQTKKPQLWKRITDSSETIINPHLENCLISCYKHLFSHLTPSNLNILHRDVESAAHAEMLLQGRTELSRLIVDIAKTIKSQDPDLWYALIVRDAKREDELDPEYENLFLQYFPHLPNTSTSHFRTSEVIFGVRTIIHAVGLNLLDLVEM